MKAYVSLCFVVFLSCLIAMMNVLQSLTLRAFLVLANQTDVGIVHVRAYFNFACSFKFVQHRSGSMMTAKEAKMVHIESSIEASHIIGTQRLESRCILSSSVSALQRKERCLLRYFIQYLGM